VTFGAEVPLTGRAQVALLEQSLRDKDDIIEGQHAELTEARRQIELLREGISHWRAKAAAQDVI